MQIHVVKRGDTIWNIAKQYGTTPEEIIRLNQPPNPNSLVVGQTLLIPSAGRADIVKSGESFYTTAQQYGVSQELEQANPGVSPADLQVGQQVQIPREAQLKRTIEVNAYLEPSGGPDDRATLREVAPYLTYVSVFSYRATRDGGLTSPNDSFALAAAREFGIAPLLVMTNFEADIGFSAELARAIITSEEVKNRLFDNLVRIIREKGFVGVNVDFERVGPEDRETYNQFLRDLAARLHAVGAILSTALAPKESDYVGGEWHGAHDYRAHGEIVDFTIIMTYEWGWSGGPAYAVAPINKMRDVLRYAVTRIPPRKILMGFPLYGYDWTLPFAPGTTARTISPQAAIRLADRENQAIEYDETLQAPFFHYYDNQGRQHEVWFEDARSAKAKLNLINEFNLRGVSFWELGNPFPQIWHLLADMFTIRKLR
ncbi:glycosyl hydrolase family 18 protein [Effusibacillus dendaii]|uniref:Spore germination protein YaaH n=1 Tax=Effusibacillus dendaii TaxID=2743772 RepID=A0A7I8DD49_9BACL|nr:glycosyl hydrolase family 18 protein [Effusibacillus dendaii]BCJ86746.1 spore germination protein YaaH [Effusibacillus dendaii]